MLKRREKEDTGEAQTDSTHIAKVPMKCLLSRNNQDGIDGVSISQGDPKISIMGKSVSVARGCYCQGTHFDVTHLRSSQEEAGTKFILHAVHAASHGATEITIHSQDTNAFVLSLRRYPQLYSDVRFVTGTVQTH